MRESEPESCAQQHRMLKVTINPTNRDKHINEASKQVFVDNLFKKSSKYTQGMLSSWKICFNTFKIQNYDDCFCILNETNKTL